MINVTIEQNCIFGEINCTEEDANLIGIARPGSMVLLVDQSGVERYYQQPLAKQFYTDLPEYDDIDIHVRFATRTDYWFQGDPSPTNSLPPKMDFLHLVLREIIHTLGFYSSWETWFTDKTVIVPRPLCDDGIGDCNIRGRYTQKKWIGFREFIFDKYLMNLKTGEMLTDKASDLNKLFDSKDIRGRIKKLEDEFVKSPQYDIAKEMYGLSTTDNTIGFLSWNDTNFSDSLVLLTNVTPFYDEINLRYVSDVLYNNTSDFLMRFQYPIGVTLQDEIINGGNFGNYTNGILTGSIGPKLMRVLETLGYATVYKPFVDYIPKIPPPRPPFDDSGSLGNSLSSITLYQICLLLIVVIYELYV
ncbi:hypothetical protein RclHR1_02220002 [Rhizophagus clarus]|uniref:Sequence orphan n=1 Tax=Rhizophagus clarus TaxID=94130 RepID=A0A2Z6QU03_9GLOM|nr:hypothetical protein RclHR1_02220002 [Rhizophagus clarus]